MSIIHDHDFWEQASETCLEILRIWAGTGTTLVREIRLGLHCIAEKPPWHTPQEHLGAIHLLGVLGWLKYWKYNFFFLPDGGWYSPYYITFLYVTSNVCLSKIFKSRGLTRDNKSTSNVVLGHMGAITFLSTNHPQMYELRIYIFYLFLKAGFLKSSLSMRLIIS